MDAEAVPATGCLARLTWLLGGPFLLLALAAAIYRNDHGALSLPSLGYWVVALLAVGVRYLDVHRLHGETVKGEPATDRDVRAYAARLLGFAAALWGLVVWLV